MSLAQSTVNNVRTVSDTKRAFYSTHVRPINSIYRRVVEELMVEMHLLAVNVDFRYDPIFALGVVSSFDQFMQGYRPESDRDSIFHALCHAVGSESSQYRRDAEQLRGLAQNLSISDLITWLNQPKDTPGGTPNGDELRQHLHSIATNPQFKYSRLFAIGLYTLLELADPEAAKDETRRTEALKQLCTTLHLPEDKLQKDLELYRSNLEKMVQVQAVLQDALLADRKKREDRAKAKEGGAPEAGSAETSPEEASSGS